MPSIGEQRGRAYKKESLQPGQPLIKANCGQAAPAITQPSVPQKPFIKIIPAGLRGLQAVSRTQRFCRASGTYYLYLRVKAALQVQNHGAITLFKPERTVS
jgi:hypothetical protein